MTNYRRLISYIYAYEGDVKGKNIGFAKLESRNGQCKLSVNVKKVYVGSSDLGVYLLAPGKEIPLGSIFIRGGSGEFRAVVSVENAADSGSGLDRCYGLTIHEPEDTWRAYTTIWEDAVAQAAEVELADVTSKKLGDAEEQISKKVEELAREINGGESSAEESGIGMAQDVLDCGLTEPTGKELAQAEELTSTQAVPGPETGGDSLERPSVQELDSGQCPSKKQELHEEQALNQGQEPYQSQDPHQESVSAGEALPVWGEEAMRSMVQTGEEMQPENWEQGTQAGQGMQPGQGIQAEQGMQPAADLYPRAEVKEKMQVQPDAVMPAESDAQWGQMRQGNHEPSGTFGNQPQAARRPFMEINFNGYSRPKKNNTYNMGTESSGKMPIRTNRDPMPGLSSRTNMRQVTNDMEPENNMQYPADMAAVPAGDDHNPMAAMPLPEDFRSPSEMPIQSVNQIPEAAPCMTGPTRRRGMQSKANMRFQWGMPPRPSIQPEATAPVNASMEPEAAAPVNASMEPEAAAPVNTSMEPETAAPVIDSGEEEILLGNPHELQRLEQEEQEISGPRQLWEGFRKRYPKIKAFDSVNGCEILTIKPQDIGLLPRENWNYGNNSFLLHGFYNYRYLILARIGDENQGRTRYILGVPGHYYSNEKYMASMFGFPHFVLSKKQPSQDGRFGYWYTDIRMENQD